MSEELHLTTQVYKAPLRARYHQHALELKWKAKAEDMSPEEERALFRKERPAEARKQGWCYTVWREEVRKVQGLVTGSKRRRSIKASSLMPNMRDWARSKGIILLDDHGQEEADQGGVPGFHLQGEERPPAEGSCGGPCADDHEPPEPQA